MAEKKKRKPEKQQYALNDIKTKGRAKRIPPNTGVI